jgi:acetyltransferase-like isoleucine patch superfamily enzyme
MVLAGSEIGDHAVIAAGAVVRGRVPPRSVVAGSPAKVVRTFECADDWVRP